MAECAARIGTPLDGINERPGSEFGDSLAKSGTLAFRVAFKLLRHREDAEDVAQEAFLRALRRFGSLRDRTRFQAWLVRVAWRLALDYRRADGRRARRDLHLVRAASGEPSAERELIAREQEAHLREAIARLPERLRLPLVLGSLEGYSVDDVAAQIGVPAGTVKSRSFAARRSLKRTLGNAGLVMLLLGGAVALLPWMRLIRPTGELPQVARDVMTPPTIAVPAPPPVRIVRAPRSADSHPAPLVEQLTQSTSVSVKRIEVPVVSPIAAIDIPVVEVPVVAVPVVRAPTTVFWIVDGPAAMAPASRLEKQ